MIFKLWLTSLIIFLLCLFIRPNDEVLDKRIQDMDSVETSVITWWAGILIGSFIMTVLTTIALIWVVI